MTPFTAYGVPADGWAPSYKGPRPSTTRSGTCVNVLGPNQLAALKARDTIFADATRRVEEMEKGS